ncbi:uncharacterized protein LOC141637893 [Silene latifolia]|uniref:uncharacterized protein LOC141637893 n=1 Tax=Silene latifolia TaxID=37657 RepID=UPI003D7737EB
MCLSLTEVAVSAVLVREQVGSQHPVYYVSKSLLPAETRYTSLETFILALVTASYKLRPYFESHTISVITNYPLKTIMRKLELSGRMAKWSMHLSGYDLKFEPRTAIKSQALADFMSDFCPALQTQAEQDILSLEEDKWEQVCSDSKLIVNHVNNCYEGRDPRMMAYLDVAKELKLRFVTFNIKQIPRDQNAEADALATLRATFKTGAISTIPIVHVMVSATLKSQQEAEVVCSTSGEENTLDWRKPYLDWLQNDILPADKNENPAGRRSGPEESLPEYQEPASRKIRLQLGGAIPSRKYNWKWSLTTHDYGRTNDSQILEYHPLEKIFHLSHQHGQQLGTQPTRYSSARF